MSIVSEIKKNKMKVFRRLYMRRRLSGGNYEATWQRIPDKYVMSWGSIQYSVDDVKPDFYKYSGLTLKLTNYDGFMGSESDDKSFFYSALTRSKTLVKIEAGYIDPDGNEYPSTPTLFIGLIGDNIQYSDDAKVTFKADHITSIFEDLPADRLDIGTGTHTASEIVELIKNYQDSGGNYFFQKFISSGAWYYSTTTDNYVLQTDTTLQNITCWKLLQKLAGAENKVLFINQDGDFNFVTKTVTDSTTAFHFSGFGDNDTTYGHNIIDYINVNEDVSKVYNRVKVKHGKDDTITSYHIRNETWEWGDSSSSFLYGVREYVYDNTFLSSATAITKATDIYNEYVWPKQKVELRSKFVPHLMVQDYVTTTFKKQRYFGDYLWGFFNWGEGIWGERKGFNIYLNDEGGRITSLKHNIDKFYSQVTMREL